MATKRLTFALVLLALSVGACSTGSHRPSSLAGSTTTSSALAPSDGATPFHEAASAMVTQGSFRFRAEVARVHLAPLHLTGEFSAPDHVHETITGTPAGPVEVAFVSGHAYRRRTDGTWIQGKASATGPGAVAGGDPRAAFRHLAAAQARAAGAGAYSFALDGTTARQLIAGASHVTGTATVSGATITDLAYTGDDPATTKVSVHYSDIGSGPEVTAPAVR